MSEEKCYSVEKDGTYCLGFPNRYALLNNDIERIFSNFGNVISVRASGDERGFRFVRYRSQEEAERAIEGLKQNKMIRILPKKPKNRNDDEKGLSKNTQKNIQEKNAGFKKKENQSNANAAKKDDDDFSDSFRTEDSSVAHPPNQKKFRPQPQRYGGKYNTSDETKNKPSDDVTAQDKGIANGEKENFHRLLRLRNMRGIIANNFDSNSASNLSEPNASNLRKSINNGLLKVNTDIPTDDEPPELVSTEELNQKSLKGSVCGDETIKILPAQEVIIANVHNNCSVLYILYLLEQFDPISITKMKSISKNNIRYCSVYFKSEKDALAVQKKFDNLDISGNKLIVCTPQMLENETS